MTTLLISQVILFFSIGLVIYIIISISKPQQLYGLNFIGVFLSPVVIMATAMQSANASSSLRGLFSYLCILGILLALICNLLGYIFAKLKHPQLQLIVLKIPSMYAGLWALGFFLLAA